VAYEQYIIDDDINGQVMRLVRGLEVTDESLSVEVIDAVCRGEGHYLGQAQTLDLMMSEYYYPHTADRTTRSDWETAGALDMRQTARQKAQETLRTHFPQILSKEVDAEIRAAFNILLPVGVMEVGGYP
jgi:trimethylamine--corrinoid protein Co-methyltransferase